MSVFDDKSNDFSTVDKNGKCKHLHVKKDSDFWTCIEDSNLEAVGIHCIDCGQFIGFAYRKVETIPEEKREIKIMIYADNPNHYVAKEDKP
jgi:hypothetical protein